MFRKLLATLTVSTLLAGPALAAEHQYVNFRMEQGKATVTGAFYLDGYTPTQIRRMMSVYCKGGNVGPIEPNGKPRKKRGKLRQKFTTTCPGGRLSRFKGRSTTFEIEYFTDGQYRNKHLVEISGSDGLGNLIYLREFAKP